MNPERSVPLAPLSSLGVGGSAAYLVRVDTAGQLGELPGRIARTGLPYYLLGGGTNTCFGDGELPLLVIKNELRGVRFEAVRPGRERVIAAAGEDWDALVAATASRGLSGFENLSGIPGTVGAAPIQNINAYGASVADTVVSVDAVSLTTGAPRTFSRAECAFSYRDSIFKQPAGQDYLVTSVTFELAHDPHPNLTYRSSSQSVAQVLALKVGDRTPTVSDIRDAILTVRRNIGMVAGVFHSAGSFFMNTIVSADSFARIHERVVAEFREQHERLSPWYWELPSGEVKIATAFLMECAGYSKTQYAAHPPSQGVGLSPLHTLSIINYGGATATDVRAFADEIVGAVFTTFGVEIVREVQYVG